MFEDLRGYIQMASGLTEVTAAKAKELAMNLVSQGMQLTTKAPDVVGQVQDMADGLVTTSKENREMLIGLIRAEVDRSVGRLGFVREDELAALRRHVQRVEQQLLDLKATRPAFPDLVKAADSAAEPDVEVVKVEASPEESDERAVTETAFNQVEFNEVEFIEVAAEEVADEEPKRKIILVQEDSSGE